MSPAKGHHVKRSHARTRTHAHVVVVVVVVVVAAVVVAVVVVGVSNGFPGQDVCKYLEIQGRS